MYYDAKMQESAKKKKKWLKDMSKEHRDYSKELEIIKTGLD